MTKDIKQPKPLPAPNSDFYELADTLNAEELALLKQVRAFMETKVAPIINKYWIEDSFPFELLPAFKELNIGGLGMQGYGCRGGSALLFGLAAMEMSRVDSSIATFFGVHNGLIRLKDVRLPEENHLQAGTSFRDTARVLRMTRYLVAWEATGCQMGAYEHALKYAQERLQFGRPIASFQLIQDLLAKMIANITACQCLVVRTAQLHAEGKLGDHHAALSKAFTTAKMRETVAWAREILGGNGITTDYDAARFFADAEALYSYEGTYQMQNLIVGKAITGLSAFL